MRTYTCTNVYINSLYHPCGVFIHLDAYVSRAECLGLDNLSGVVLSLEKTDSLLSSHGLAAALLLRVRACEISPTYFGMSSGIANVRVLFKQPYC